MIIRPASADDIPFMMHLERTCPSAAHWSELQYRQLFEGSRSGSERLILVIRAKPAATVDSSTEDDREPLLGFLVAHRVVSDWELENIVVSAAARRKGLGLQLLNAMLTRAEETNGASVFLEVRESNTAARSLYQRAGFGEGGRRKSYYTNPDEDAILYSWTPC